MSPSRSTEIRMETPLRIVLAKVGLDGHDRGIKVVARGLRDSGFHVIYAGLWQKIEDVVRAVADEDADYLGISILSGAHMTLAPRVLEALRAAGLSHVGVIMGGIIPAEDIEPLHEMGVLRIFGPGTPIGEIAQFLSESGSRTLDVPSPKTLAPCQRDAVPRWITHITRGMELDELDKTDEAGRRRAYRIALTGSGGVGKSTLVGRLVQVIRDAGIRVAVLACDPESSLTGGALLGDRVRMVPRADDPDCLIRSLATPSGHQGVADRLEPITRLLDHCGFDVVLVETVGIGQGDVAVRDLVDTVVLLVQPQTGDTMQWEKAGVLEVADVVVVHKGDLPGADRVVGELQEVLHLDGAARAVPVIKASAARGEGIDALWSTLAGLRSSGASDTA